MSYWETVFSDGAVWEFEPADSAFYVADYFSKNGVNNVLIPGIGYARNAKPFIENGIRVSGIEVSKSAIELAKKSNIKATIHHGSVLNMPFDDKKYDGIYCYSLLHLFNKYKRLQILNSCYEQLDDNGYMFFVVVSTKSEMYGRGRMLSKDRFEISKGLKVFFYESSSLFNEFFDVGLIEYYEINEPIKHMNGEPDLKCYIVKCQKIQNNLCK